MMKNGSFPVMQAEEAALKGRLFDESPDAQLLLDLKTGVIEANLAALALFRFESPDEIRGRTIIDFIAPDERPVAVRELIGFSGKGYLPDMEHRMLKSDGTSFSAWLKASLLKDSAMKPEAVMVSVRDISEKRLIESHLLQSRKMESLESLAGGVAVEFYRLTREISAVASPLKRELGSSLLKAPVENIIASAASAASVIRQLLQFSRRDRITVEPADLNAVIDNSLKILTTVLPESIELRFTPAGEELMIMAERDQISQIMVNIATYSRKAMAGKGVLTITNAFTEMDRNFIAAHGFGKLWKYALLTIADTGEGMDEETRANIFEPFFSPDEAGAAEGLSLSAAYGIVKELKGYIDVSSVQGQGTTFRIYLPLVKTGR